MMLPKSAHPPFPGRGPGMTKRKKDQKKPRGVAKRKAKLDPPPEVIARLQSQVFASLDEAGHAIAASVTGLDWSENRRCGVPLMEALCRIEQARACLRELPDDFQSPDRANRKFRLWVPTYNATRFPDQ